jgi:hypothetical protein
LGTRYEVITDALRSRFIDVCERFMIVRTGLMELDSQVFPPLPASINTSALGKLEKPDVWLDCEFNGLDAFATLAGEKGISATESPQPDGNDFLKELKAAARKPDERFRLLLTRYRHPLNIAANSEALICEHLLERLMVADRAQAERQSIAVLYEPDLLLKLNLIAIKSSLCDDLRYIDALNYIYELSPPDWLPKSEYAWLFGTFLIFYARALEVCSCQIEKCA